MFLKAVLFACVGVTMEVVFTAIVDHRRGDVRLKGFSYIWMLPIYALVPVFLAVLHPPLQGLLLPARLAIYTAILLAMEYATGWILQAATGSCPWEAEYRGKRWAVHGLMRLDYAPAWALACWIFESLYLAL